MPKNRHLTFGDMQAQKSREEHLAKMRAMLKPAEAAAEEPGEPAVSSENVAKQTPMPASKPVVAKAAPTKKAAAKSAPKKTAAKKPVAKKKGKK